VRVGTGLHRVGDPRRLPTWAPGPRCHRSARSRTRLLIARLAAEAPCSHRHAAVPPGDRRRTRRCAPAAVRHGGRPLLPSLPVRGVPRGPARHEQPAVRPAVAVLRARHAVRPRRGDAGHPAPAVRRGRTSSCDAPVEHVGARQVTVAGDRRAAAAVVVAAGARRPRRCCPASTGPATRRVTTLLPPGARAAGAGGRHRPGRRAQRSGHQHGRAHERRPVVRPGSTPGQQQHAARRRAGAGGAPAPVPAVRLRRRGLAAGGRLRRRGRPALPVAADGALPQAGAARAGLYVCGDHRDSASIQGRCTPAGGPPPPCWPSSAPPQPAPELRRRP
jgi:hypothetical protein